MELNRTSEYSCKTENHLPQRREDALGPQDSREVKVFSLEGSQQSSRQEKSASSSSSSKTQAREGRSEDGKRIEEKSSAVASKEEDSAAEEEEGAKFFVNEQVAAGIALFDLPSVAVQEVQSMSSTVAVASVDLSWVGEVILSTVSSMTISELEGQQMVELVLEATHQIPEVFVGANLTLMQSGEELSVNISNFQDPSQAVQAAQLVSNNAEQLSSLVSALYARNLRLAEFVVGSQVVQLPRQEEIQTPLHMIASAIRYNEDKEQEREGQNQQQQEQQESPYKIEEARL
ncbi:DUF5421 family protein [Chlamydia pecorum]|uniref:Uncharacterized protein n=1 Tax=Chlamydia pecorum (strain ATCC VR-628 / DSM 29919 / E58) TaxID=331635 RepID=A0AA34WHQ9_CHLPE|nr:DUF5421 family protein [Chlamydia pecorum]AEB41343.1 conserved hypothetical protein [Chlamydia pecorum E58]ETF38693.1 hypothetical protein CpecS_0301 [Chlamydia pecorum VR629]UFP06905.1 DUF5421 family protein [Chlamydia pecorum]UJT76719.1 hypothetical protein NSWBovSBE_0307 [Chlamydia pecorum]